MVLEVYRNIHNITNYKELNRYHSDSALKAFLNYILTNSMIPRPSLTSITILIYMMILQNKFYFLI